MRRSLGPWVAVTTLLLGSSVLVGTGCIGPDPTREDPGFVLRNAGDAVNATLDFEGSYRWWANSIDEEDYRAWATDFGSEGWEPYDMPASIHLLQSEDTYLGGSLDLDAGHHFEFTKLALGFGWRGIYTSGQEEIPVDLQALGLAPKDGIVDYTRCEGRDTRILVAFSKYPDGMDQLWEEALASALEQGLKEPETWYDLVLDPVMYERLFGYYRTHTMVDTTFAFVSVQIDPLCEDLRLSYRSESDMVGPVTVADE